MGKYDRARVKTYAAVDPSKEALKRTEKAIRLKGNPFRATYVPADPAQPAPTVAPLPSPKPAAGRIQSAFDDVVAYASTLFSEDEQETPEPATLEVPELESIAAQRGAQGLGQGAGADGEHRPARLCPVPHQPPQPGARRLDPGPAALGAAAMTT